MGISQLLYNGAMNVKYYKALVEKDSGYEGIFFAGILTTGVFCRPTCPARKPKFENCEFFKTAQEALLAGYRPCKRCKPLSPPNETPEIVRKLIQAVEAEPEKRWRATDFRKMGLHASSASRYFKKHFGMTFVAYARARRMGIALKQIREKKTVLDTQLDVGYESGSGFRDAFSRILGKAPKEGSQIEALKAEWIDSPLGPILAIADDGALHLLEFVDRRGLEREIERLRKKFAIVPGKAKPLDSIKKELKGYFEGKLSRFTTPFVMHGTPFQKRVWEELQKIPPGETRSYAQLASSIGKPTAFRAVAGANGANQIAILIPCHRVINTNGNIGGYGGGVARKKWLLEHERNE